MSQAGVADGWAFPPEPSSSREARRRVSRALESSHLDEIVTTVALVVSELATNAVLHARTPFEVRVTLHERYVRVEVHDGTGRRPARKYFSDTAVSGRGLRLIEALCDSWGVEPDPHGNGKTVWAEVALAGSPDRGQPFDIDAVDPL